MKDEEDTKEYKKFKQKMTVINLVIGLAVGLFFLYLLREFIVIQKLNKWCESWEGEIFFTDLITGKSEMIDCIDKPTIVKDYHYYTKAICEGSYCLDILIECNAERIMRISPVTKPIDFGEDWEEPIPRKLINRWC